MARERPGALLVWTSLLAWSVAVFAVTRSHFDAFLYQRYDLGNMVQAVWSTTQGRPLEMTLGTGEQASRLAAHVDPILVLFAPLWLVAPTPLALVAGQVAACALGAVPAYWLGRRHLASERAAVTLALAYLAYPWLAWNALEAMHPVTLAIPLLLFAIWALDSDRLLVFACFAVLTAATGELMGLPVAILGIWYWLSRGRRRPGLAIAAAGLTWTAVCVKVIVPAFAGHESDFYSYFETVGGSPEGVVRVLLTDPGRIASEVFTERDFVYLFLVGAPLLGAFLLSPLLAAAALPHLTANGLTTIVSSTDPRHHHTSVVIPLLVGASILGIARLRKDRQGVAASLVLGASLASSLLLGPWSFLPADRAAWMHSSLGTGAPPPEHQDALRHAISLVPASAPVAATNEVGSHLSARRYFYSLPVLGTAEWVVVDQRDPWVPLPPPGPRRTEWGRLDSALIAGAIRRLESDEDWRRVFRRDDVLVFARTATKP